MKTHKKNNLLLAFSLFLFIVACKPEAKEGAVEDIPIGKNTAKMIDLEDTNANTIVAIRVCFSDSICGVFALDNGMVDQCVMDSSFFSKISTHYSLQEKESIFSKTGKKHIKIYEGKIEFDLCNKKINTKKIMVVSGFSQQNHKLDGLIGSDFFVDNIVEINYDSRTVSFLDSIDKKAKGYAAIPLLRRERFPNCKDLYINLPKIGKQRVILDLGYFGGLQLSYSTWEAVGLDTNRYLRKWVCRSIQNPPETAYTSTLDSIHIGNLMVKNPLVVTQLFEDPYQRFDMLDWEGSHKGILGRELLSLYNMIIDYQKDTLYLKKRIE